MFLKLGIIVGIVIIGGIVFSSEISTLFPNTSTTTVNSLKEDVKNLGTQAAETTEKKVNESFNEISEKANKKLNEEIDKTSDNIHNKISETGESTQMIISENISSFNPIEPIQNFFIKNQES